MVAPGQDMKRCKRYLYAPLILLLLMSRLYGIFGLRLLQVFG